jgi:hypothetical protein
MNTVFTPTTRAVRPLAAMTIVGALALGLAAAATLVMMSDATAAGIVASLGDYLTEVGEALGNQ